MIAEHVLSKVAAKAIADVLDERATQVAQGYTPEHDDAEHGGGEIAAAAAAYAQEAALTARIGDPRSTSPLPPTWFLRTPAKWPWGATAWRPGAVRKMLVKACALLLAEIERLDRATLAREARR